MIDLTPYPRLVNTFGGSEQKMSILYKNRIFMVKFPNRVRAKNSLSYMNNQFSEDIGCKIYKALGYETQNTFLATYHLDSGEEKIVVACESFTQDGKTLVEFQKLALQVEGSSPQTRIELANVLQAIEDTPQIQDKQSVKRRFWDMFLIDGWLGNKDRNLENWGFLLEKDGSLSLAPIYDCGSSLSPLYTEEPMTRLLASPTEFKAKEFNVPSCYRIEGKQILFHEAVRNPWPDLKEAMYRVLPRIYAKELEIGQIIEQTPTMTETHKDYVKKSLALRWDLILKPAMKKL